MKNILKMLAVVLPIQVIFILLFHWVFKANVIVLISLFVLINLYYIISNFTKYKHANTLRPENQKESN